MNNTQNPFDSISPPQVRQVNIGTIADQIVTTIPAPPNPLYKYDYHYGDRKKDIHDTLMNSPGTSVELTLENVEELQGYFTHISTPFKLEVGDLVRAWDDGGWRALAGRSGLEVHRNGEQVAKILTRMS